MTGTEVSTAGALDVINVTDLVAEAFAGEGTGIGFVFTPHTTAGILISEADEPDLFEDFKTVAGNWLDDIGPFRHAKNDNPNTVAHVLSSFAGTSVQVPVREGHLALGHYQNVLLLELDGPRVRQLFFDFVPTGGVR